MEFKSFQKIPRLSRECVITEKIDGTNASIWISEEGEFKSASRTRFITPENDNFGFALWAKQHEEELRGLGPGAHFGEWWGVGIQRGYELSERRFSLFNCGRWTAENVPKCCSVVPILYQGPFLTEAVEGSLLRLATFGSQAAPGYLKPEGVVIYHKAAKYLFKKTIIHDEQSKGDLC